MSNRYEIIPRRRWVKIDPDDRVLEIRSDRYTDDFGHRLWPFGD